MMEMRNSMFSFSYVLYIFPIYMYCGLLPTILFSDCKSLESKINVFHLFFLLCILFTYFNMVVKSNLAGKKYCTLVPNVCLNWKP